MFKDIEIGQDEAQALDAYGECIIASTASEKYNWRRGKRLVLFYHETGREYFVKIRSVQSVESIGGILAVVEPDEEVRH